MLDPQSKHWSESVLEDDEDRQTGPQHREAAGYMASGLESLRTLISTSVTPQMEW